MEASIEYADSSEGKRKNAFYTYLEYGKNSKEFRELAIRYGMETNLISACSLYAKYRATPEERQTYEQKRKNDEKEMLKYIFTFCVDNGFEDHVLQSAAKTLNITPAEMRSRAKIYLYKYSTDSEKKKYRETYDKYVNKNIERGKKKLISSTASAKTNVIFDKLLELNTREEVIKYLSSMEINSIPYLRSKIDNYFNIRKLDMSVEEKKTASDKLHTYLDIYNEYITQQKKPEKDAKKHEEQRVNDYLRLLPQRHREYFKQEGMTVKEEEEIFLHAQQVVKGFVENDYSSKEAFIKDGNIDMYHFDKCLILVQKYDKDLHERYLAKMEKLKAQRFAILASTIKQMIAKIKNGISIDDKNTREFDLLDYYLTTGIKMEELLKICSEICNEEELRIIRSFIYKNKENKGLDIHQTLEGKHSFMQNNVQREVTKLEKETVIKYLREHNVPLYNKTYNIALKRYLAGQLDEKEEEISRDIKR